jgi:replicative DNA helicase
MSRQLRQGARKSYAGLDEGSRETTDIDLTLNAIQRFDEYLNVKTRPNGLLGIATGFRTIDQATAGLQPGQLITIIAPPKTGKSVLAMQMAVNVHRDGFVPMFQSFEMTNLEQQQRHDSMRARISHQRLITGTLRPEEEGRYKTLVTNNMRNDREKFWLVDSSSGSTLSGVTAKLQLHRPSILFIDGMYLMTDEQTGEQNTPQALTNLTRGFKRLAQTFKIPIVITTQSLDWKKGKGGRLTANSIGYSS